MNPEKEFIEQLGHYFNMRLTEENKKYLTKMLDKYHSQKPEKVKLIKIPVRK
jgi:hypothetical protein